MKKRKVFEIGMVALLLCTFAWLPACINEEVQMGKFYSLQEAYEQGFLSVEELQSIAFYYHDGSIDSDFAPISKNPERLSAEMEKNLKHTYRMDFLNMPTAEFNRITILKYYGTYRGSVVVGITDNYNAYDLFVMDEYTVGGVTFYHIAMSDISVWRALEK